jgi:hypothetical protein
MYPHPPSATIELRWILVYRDIRWFNHHCLTIILLLLRAMAQGEPVEKPDTGLLPGKGRSGARDTATHPGGKTGG